MDSNVTIVNQPFLLLQRREAGTGYRQKTDQQPPSRRNASTWFHLIEPPSCLTRAPASPRSEQASGPWLHRFHRLTDIALAHPPKERI